MRCTGCDLLSAAVYVKRRFPEWAVIQHQPRATASAKAQDVDRVKSVTLPANDECIVDFVVEPFRSFNSAQIAIEFTGRLEEKPYAIELLNRFVEVGSRRHVVPGQVGNDDYIDKHKLYHCIENMSWPKGLTKLMDSK